MIFHQRPPTIRAPAPRIHSPCVACVVAVLQGQIEQGASGPSYNPGSHWCHHQQKEGDESSTTQKGGG